MAVPDRRARVSSGRPASRSPPDHPPGGPTRPRHRTKNGSVRVMIGSNCVVETRCADEDPPDEPENQQPIILLILSFGG
jgi:hypothetical protein